MLFPGMVSFLTLPKFDPRPDEKLEESQQRSAECAECGAAHVGSGSSLVPGDYSSKL